VGAAISIKTFGGLGGKLLEQGISGIHPRGGVVGQIISVVISLLLMLGGRLPPRLATGEYRVLERPGEFTPLTGRSLVGAHLFRERAGPPSRAVVNIVFTGRWLTKAKGGS